MLFLLTVCGFVASVQAEREPYSYTDYAEMVTEILGLPSKYPGCVQAYDAIEKWPNLVDTNVCVECSVNM